VTISEAQPYVRGDDVKSEDRASLTADDPLLRDWLRRAEARRPLSSWPPPRRTDPEREREPLGDSLADAWFR
jgi:hypothetical protein